MARYDAFVLRVWRSGTREEEQWAGRLEHLPDGATFRFGSLDALLAYLGAELAGAATAQPGSPTGGPRVGERSSGVRRDGKHLALKGHGKDTTLKGPERCTNRTEH
jgi:hypothetical protein